MKMKLDKGAIFASMAIIMVASVLAGAGTMAYFSDVGTVGPTIRAGNVNLRLSKDKGSWSDELHFDFPTGFAPGDDFTILVYMKNTGTSGSKFLYVRGTNPDGHGSNWKLADVIEITDMAVTWESTTWSGTGMYDWFVTVYDTSGPGDSPRNDGDKVWDLGEFIDSYCMKFWEESGSPYAATEDYLDPKEGNIQAFRMTFHFNEEAGNDYQDLVFDFDIEIGITDDPHVLHWASPYGYAE